MNTPLDKWRSRWDNAFLEYLMFELISEKARFGAEIVEFANETLSSKIKIPTVYAILNRSSEWGLLEEARLEKTKSTRGTKRRYFDITSAGEEYLVKIREVITESMKLVHLQQRRLLA